MKIKLRKICLALFLVIASCCLMGCKKKSQEKVFKPRLDTQSKCKIQIAGRYQNFEALEAEFDRFNEFYPNVELSYTYLDNYKGTIATALAGQDAPDIFMTFPWMLDKTSYDPLLENAENLADSKATGIELSAVNQKLLFYMDNGSLPMVLKEAGYKSPILSDKYDSSIMASLIYPFFTKEIMNNPEAIAKLNKLDNSAGEYTRSSLEWIEKFRSYGFLDLEECAKLKDNYDAVIRRFFEGDVPMMLASADVVSGTKKREALSEAFTKNPFKYSFHSVPVMEKGGAVVDVPSVEFSVNKKSGNLEMANEFMRFLLRTEELNNLAMIKRLITCSTVYSFDDVYAPLGNTEHLYQLELGILDNTYSQLRMAAYRVLRNKMTVDEAVENYGSFK